MKTLRRDDPNDLNIVENVSTPFSSYVNDVVQDPQMLWRGFSYGSVIGTVSDFLTNTKQFEPDEEYDVNKDPRLFKYRTAIPKYFASSVSAKETTNRLLEFEQHLKDTNNPIYQITSLLGEISDPSTWVFGSGLIKGVKTVAKFKQAGKELTQFSKLMAGEEAVKQMLNENRSYQDALVVGGFAWYLNRIGKKFLKYEDGSKIFEEMKFYENASNTEMPPIISKATSNTMYSKQSKNIEDAIVAIKSEYPDIIINRGKGVGKYVNDTYVPAFIRRNPDLSVAELNIDEKGIIKMYKDKRYLKSRIPGVEPFKEGDFANEGEWLEFVIRHELAHVRLSKDANETKAAYENRINKIAYQQILENRTGKVARQGSVLVDQQVIDNSRRLSELKYRNKIDPRITDDQLKYIKTGTFLEKLGYTPMDRLINYGNRTVTEFALNMFKSPLYIEANKLNYGEMPDSAEAIKAVSYTPLLKDFTDKLETHYAEYLLENGINKFDVAKKVKLKFSNNKQILTWQQFKEAVPYAILRGYKYPEVPKVEQAARSFFQFTKPLGDRIDQTGLYLIKPDREYEFFKNALNELEKFRDPRSQMFDPKRIFTYTYPRTKKKVSYTYEQLKEKVSSLEQLINDVSKSGKRKNYFTVMWNFDLIVKNYETFFKDVYPIVLRNSDPQYAEKIMENFKNYKPYEVGEDSIEGVLAGDEFIFKETSYSRYLRSRSIPLKDIDYEFLLDKGYIERDIEVIASQYFKSVVPDIILTEKFGDPFGFGYLNDYVKDVFAPGLRQIQKEFDSKIYNELGEVINEPLRKKRNKILKDSEAIRDLFKGRYGLADNPQRFLSRAYRLVKPLNSMGMLSGALAGLPDTARIITYNGLKKAIPRLLQMLNISVTSEVFKKANKQANRAGQAIEFMLDHGRANQVYGSHHDTFATFNNVDRFVQSAAAFNFKFINQMASWTWAAKTVVSSDVGTEIIEAAFRFVNGKATSKEIMKFKHAGVSPEEIQDIVDAYKKYGFGKDGTDFNASYSLLKFANTDKWIENSKEINAAFRFNRMLNETIDYVIVTPTLGDTPLFASRELGAVIMQFKKFIFAFDRKVMQRGLQERDLSFITQIMALLFFGMLVDGIRSQQLGNDYSKKDIRDKIYDGFERSGAGGIFLETNRMLETLTDNRVGIRPLIGVGKPYGTSLAWKTGVLGPTASTLATISQIMYDWGRGKHTHHTARRIRKLVPFNNIWYLDSIFDKLEKGIR